MDIQNDETLQVYLEESIEHLADIENDFLAIEEAGEDIDEDLVNKVYRAAHSIKGGAGFMGLTNIKDLTHEMENILGKIRSREMVPNPEIINILLMAADTLRNLVNDVFNSNEVDISEHVEALKSISEGGLSNEPAPGPADVSGPDVKSVFPKEEEDIANAQKDQKNVYLIQIDLIHDVHMKDKTPLNVIEEMQQTGIILDTKLDIDSVGTLEQEGVPDRFPFIVLFATILKPDDINALFEIDEEKIFEVTEDLTLKPIGAATPQESPVPEETGPKPVVEEEKTVPEEPEIKVAEPTTPVEPAEETQEPEKAQTDKRTIPLKRDQRAKPANPAKAGPTGSTASKASVADTSLRVHVSLLDSLMNLAGELVLSRNQLIQSMSSNDHRLSEIASQRVDMITSELQEAIMLTRMQPIGSVFNKFPRVVRDLARNLGKDIELSIEGKEVELDKTIIEAIGDPLTHLVRNSVDHGIETPDERSKAGKTPTGTVVLRAYHEAGQVNIEITDDGKGLDGDKLAGAAVAKGVISEDQAKVMSEQEKVNLIFLPGFSMAEKVTDVSGRGVGMDVVKTNLDKLGGVVDIDSKPGKGTTIHVKLPLTLAIIPSQIISTGGERYAIPQVNMEELLRIPADRVKERIEKVGNAEVVRLRGKLLPLIRLADVIGVERKYLDCEEGEEKEDRRENIADRRSRMSEIETCRSEVEIPSSAKQKREKLSEQGADPVLREDETGKPEPTVDNPQHVTRNTQHVTRNSKDRRYHADSALNIVVVSAGALKYGLVVDQLHDSEEIVVKPLGRHLKNCKGYAGATIMGDGRVALILDVAGISRMAELTSVEGSERTADVREQEKKSKADEQLLLIFRNAEDEQFSVPLSLVSRIEKIKRESIEHVGGKNVIQYRGASLPLVAIDEVAKVKPLAEKEDLLVIVFLIAGREVGLLATDPVDAIDVSTTFDESTLKQPGIMGSAIIGDYTTQMVDIFGLMEAINPDWFSEREAVHTSDGKTATILYAEDSRFFRTQVKGFIEGEGYNVIDAEDGMVAWNLLQEHADEISLVVTDVEMPNLDGLGLAKKIKDDERYSHLPIIALTTLAGEEEIARGKAMGVDDYQVKLDKEKLMESIHGWLSG